MHAYLGHIYMYTHSSVPSHIVGINSFGNVHVPSSWAARRVDSALVKGYGICIHETEDGGLGLSIRLTSFSSQSGVNSDLSHHSSNIYIRYESV